jgi:methylmalonyl-CoA mutase
MYYEHKKHDGSLPLIGVNTFLPEAGSEEVIEGRELARSGDEEKQMQVDNVADCQARNREAHAAAVVRLQSAALNRENIFAELMNASKYSTLGQMSHALYSVGGLYRRNM